MSNKLSLQLLLGIIIGLLMPLLGVYLMLDTRPELVGIQKFEGDIVKQVNVKIITLGMIINAGLFFVALQLNKEEAGRGILMSSVLYLIGIFIYRFLL
jgi:formate-dependent nitrite reductase membrane component NrfD